jgi:enoyl-CoA hydratase
MAMARRNSRAPSPYLRHTVAVQPTMKLSTMTYAVSGKIARITLNRPEQANALTLATPVELSACVERANLDPAVHVIALSGAGAGFCGGYDLRLGAQEMSRDPGAPWDPLVDFALMSRNVRGFMSLFHSDKPVVCKVHGFCVAGGTDLALCADLLVIEDKAKIGYPPARVWGVPTTAMWMSRIGPERTKRLLFTGDCLSGIEAVAWGLAIDCAPAAQLDARFEALLQRIAFMPVNQLMMMKLIVNQTVESQALRATQVLGALFDGISRHTAEGYASQQRAEALAFKPAVRETEGPFGDVARVTIKG